MAGMGWRTTGDVATFLAVAGEYLRSERVKNTVMLSVTESIRENPGLYPGGGDADPDGSPLFGWWARDQDGGGIDTGAALELGGAFMQTPPFPVVLSAVPATVAAELAARTLAGRPLSGVNAYQEAAMAFGAAWQESTGGQVDVHSRLRLYRLERLHWPDPPDDGAARTAGEADAALLTDWFTAFVHEANGRDLTAAAAAAEVQDRLGHGGIAVWAAGGEPVSFAAVSRLVAGMARVGPVYTPPQLRGRGYGTAVTAAVSQQALRAGAEDVLLYTDLANPVSNSIYQRIGYRPVEDRVVLAFSGG
jgi:GNAT superfamily N-acetyltransferase